MKTKTQTKAQKSKSKTQPKARKPRPKMSFMARSRKTLDSKFGIVETPNSIFCFGAL